MNIQKIELLVTVPTLLVVELWANEYQLEAGHPYILDFQSENEGKLEVVEETEGFTVFGWNGSTYTLTDGDEIIDTVQIEFPKLPKGMKTSEMFKMFGLKSSSKD